MGAIIGVILIGMALFIGIGITVVANGSVKKFKEDQYVHYSTTRASWPK